MRRPSRPLLLALALLPGCACDTVPEDAVTRCQAKVEIGSASTDILFVIDESGSMDEEQQNLQDNLSDFVTALANAPVRNDLRIGVTTTSVTAWNPLSDPVYASGPNACAGCAPYPAGALVAIERDGGGAPIPFKLWYTAAAGWLGPRWLDDESATLVADFEINVRLGIDGSGKEQPVRAARLALSDRIADGVNAGFLRAGARLAVVILTDEDDCSDTAGNLPPNPSAGQAACHDPDVKFAADQLDPLDDFVTFLRAPIDGEARDPIVAVIAGFDEVTLAPDQCGTAFDAPTRLDALVTALGPARAFKDSICRTDFGPGLQAIANLLVPQTVPLEGAIPDPRMLAVSITRGGGAVVGCPVAAAGSSEAAAAGAVYTPPAGGAPPSLTFQNACVLRQSDRVDVRVVCAG